MFLWKTNSAGQYMVLTISKHKTYPPQAKLPTSFIDYIFELISSRQCEVASFTFWHVTSRLTWLYLFQTGQCEVDNCGATTTRIFSKVFYSWKPDGKNLPSQFIKNALKNFNIVCLRCAVR